MSSEFEVSLHVSPFSSELIAALVDISSTVFGDIEPDYVEWRVRNMPEAMARLNLRYGFEVCGVRAEPGRTQVLYSKALG